MSVRVQCGVHVLLCPVSLREGRDVRLLLGAVHSAISDVSCVLCAVCCAPCVVGCAVCSVYEVVSVPCRYPDSVSLFSPRLTEVITGTWSSVATCVGGEGG